MINPLYDKVLVKRLENEEKSSGGIIIPEAAQEKTQLAIVIAIGCGKILNDGSLKPLILKIGDKIILNKYSGSEFNFESKDYLILKEEEVLGIVN